MKFQRSLLLLLATITLWSSSSCSDDQSPYDCISDGNYYFAKAESRGEPPLFSSKSEAEEYAKIYETEDFLFTKTSYFSIENNICIMKGTEFKSNIKDCTTIELTSNGNTGLLFLEHLHRGIYAMTFEGGTGVKLVKKLK